MTGRRHGRRTHGSVRHIGYLRRRRRSGRPKGTDRSCFAFWANGRQFGCHFRRRTGSTDVGRSLAGAPVHLGFFTVFFFTAKTTEIFLLFLGFIAGLIHRENLGNHVRALSRRTTMTIAWGEVATHGAAGLVASRRSFHGRGLCGLGPRRTSRCHLLHGKLRGAGLWGTGSRDALGGSPTAAAPVRFLRRRSHGALRRGAPRLRRLPGRGLLRCSRRRRSWHQLTTPALARLTRCTASRTGLRVLRLRRHR